MERKHYHTNKLHLRTKPSNLSIYNVEKYKTLSFTPKINCRARNCHTFLPQFFTTFSLSLKLRLPLTLCWVEVEDHNRLSWLPRQGNKSIYRSSYLKCSRKRDELQTEWVMKADNVCKAEKEMCWCNDGVVGERNLFEGVRGFEEEFEGVLK